MTWLVVLRAVRDEMPFAPTEDEDRIVSAHFDYLCGLRDEGRLLARRSLSRPLRHDRTGRARDRRRGCGAQDVDEDPAIVGGVMRAEVRPFRVSILRS